MKVSPLLTFAALLTLSFTLSVGLAPQAASWSEGKGQGNFLGLMFGDGRQLLANQFFTMADVYFHSGYYPSIFDKNSGEQKEIISASHGRKETEEDEKNEDFLGRPKDWIDAFGRNFKITRHTHLENGNEREILPWLRLAADLDPQKTETYTVGAFFLREHLHRPDQAEVFLREGLRSNPDNTEILFELGSIYELDTHEIDRARNVWELAVKKFRELGEDDQKDQRLTLEKITVNLANLEEQMGNYDRAIYWFREGEKVTLDPHALDSQINDVQKKISAKQP